LWAGQPDRHNESPWLLALQSRPVAVAARVVCTTPEACARLGALHAGLAHRLVMVPNGYDPRLLAMRRPRSGRRDGPARHDPAAIAAALERLLAHPPAPPTPEELAPYDRSRLAARLAGVLEEVAPATRRPPARPPAAAPGRPRAATGARRRSRSR